MDLKNVLLSFNGRMSRQPYWIGTLILFGAGVVANFIPLVNLLFPLATIYVYVCLYNKRLHDLGRSGWWQLIVWIGGLGLVIAGLVMMIPVVMQAIQGAADQEAMRAAILASGGGLMMGGLGFLIIFVFHVGLGILPGQPGANRYGPNPLSPVDTAVF